MTSKLKNLSMQLFAYFAIFLCFAVYTDTKSLKATEIHEFPLVTSVWNSLLDFEECKCKGGSCEERNGRLVCECFFEWGHHMPDTCYKCDCGSGANCTFDGFFATQKRCICREGYEDKGGTCIGTCNKNPCKNGGECISDGYQIECKCKAPFTGSFCEIENCAQNRCNNKGQCVVNEDRSEKCVCPYPYDGDFCERDTYIIETTWPETTTLRDPCRENPCQNGGSCFASGDSFRCWCQEPFFGSRCETDPCFCNPCKNEGICKVEEGDVKCYCADPFSGKFCDSRTDACTRNLCENDGICKMENKVEKCFCKDSFTGEFCESRSGTDLKIYIIILGVVSALVIIFLIIPFCIFCYRNNAARTV